MCTSMYRVVALGVAGLLLDDPAVLFVEAAEAGEGFMGGVLSLTL